MKIGNKQAIGENLLYVLVWATVILVPVLNSQMLAQYPINLQAAWVVWRQIIPYLTIFIVHNYWIAPRYLIRRKPLKYILLNFAFITVVFSIVSLYERFIVDDYALDPTRLSFTNHEVYWNILFALFMNGTNGGIKLLYRSLLDEQKMEMLRQENLRAEMDALRYQINPHFFMNTLNNIHALVDIDPEVAKTAVIDLSKMMRYVLYDAEREAISLSQDIEFLRNYIDLMRIRYAEQVEITFDYPREVSDRVAIPPLILIVFAENAFKYGVSYNRHSYIHISVFHSEGTLTTIVSNSRPERNEQPLSTGIGLENVRKRLELTYGADNYTLDVCEEQLSYTVKLVIPTLDA